MGERRVALVTALIVGVAGDLLLRAGPWGTGLSLWVVLAVGAAIATAWSTRRRVFSSGFLLRGLPPPRSLRLAELRSRRVLA